MKQKDRMDQIAALAQGAAELAGQELVVKLVEIFRVGKAAYEEVTGGPVDPSMVPKIDPLE